MDILRCKIRWSGGTYSYWWNRAARISDSMFHEKIDFLFIVIMIGKSLNIIFCT